MITIRTSKGDIRVALDKEQVSDTVDNFLRYVNEGFYNGTLFHRVIDGFMIQGGGFDEQFNQKETHAPVVNEAKYGKTNKRGTLAMARTMDPHSATAQFFINVVDNNFLNFTGEHPQGYGYCVFGEVTEGMDVVDAIAKLGTTSRNGHADVPSEDVVIIDITMD